MGYPSEEMMAQLAITCSEPLLKPARLLQVSVFLVRKLLWGAFHSDMYQVFLYLRPSMALLVELPADVHDMEVFH